MSTLVPASVWVQLWIEGEDKPSGHPCEIRPIPGNVNDLTKAAKEELKPALDDTPLNQIFVYPPGTTVTATGADADHYKPGKNLADLFEGLRTTPPISIDDDNPFIVVAPAPPQQQRLLFYPDLVDSLAEMAKDYTDKKRSILLSHATNSAKDELLRLLCLTERGASWVNMPRDPDLPSYRAHEWLEGDEDTAENREAYTNYLTKHVRLATGYSFMDVQPKRDLLTVVVMGREGERKIRGTTDVVVAKLSDIENDAVRNGVEALFELKKPDKLTQKDHGPQMIGQHVSASYLNKSIGVVSFLTDLRNSWTIFWYGRNEDGTEVVLFKLLLEGEKGGRLALYILESLKDQSRRELLPTSFSDRLSFNDLYNELMKDGNNPKRQRTIPDRGTGGGSLDQDTPPQPPEPGQRHPSTYCPAEEGGRSGRPQPQGGQGNNTRDAQLEVMDRVAVLRHLAPQHSGDIADELDLLDMVDEADQHEIVMSFAMKHIVPYMTGHYPPST
mmetsp:Transcript_5658/g.12418  ORF Transcript_5658/g.12418 Transcript_5658/m.12418 type:complete len:500 (-) Transcript_5658:259-1758(-)|eukprot:CAMPEP_0172555116 /NCGR_PEP_ID=MMETSP1067-20121228/58048_1 /TAXON_ID=265564 ORGANISM="Thalassiosira punctigera, Strain Tpunct2005C2" /NCGR_SAMPLE_ID=MMETSP1067 /ASSEMBLY_ACC=CAM_ASM_000444 /LENGTH=499 /DNA_ID=CAMNT_0013343625 /DNA_START=160 /DNA_END=1659 /DNA_ORIENTATION=-